MALPIYQTVPYSRFSEVDIYLFREGTHYHLYEKFGAHPIEHQGTYGTYFSVWAPNAHQVTVVGNFNGWNQGSHPLFSRWDSSGIWEGFIPGVGKGDLYKYVVYPKGGQAPLEKGDPFAFFWETPSRTASIVWDLEYSWKEGEWQGAKGEKNTLASPMSIYEVHFGSWKKNVEQGRSLTYREMSEHLPRYVKEMGFTHVEFMPLMEHPFYGSWGYQKTGYFAPSGRYGTPQEFMHLIERLHEEGIGVILDWVPSHFPQDAHALSRFDGTALYEHEDPRQGFHPDWNSAIFNYDRNEVRSFLLSSAIFWIEKYHVDGLRVDAVSSMLYLDYSRGEGGWVPNVYGGRENLGAIEFLRKLNIYVYDKYPHIQMFAEESTAWPMVSRPTNMGGLGFGLKWDMGWMHDTLNYFNKDAIYRKYHHNDLLFSMYYFYNENFVLSLSHDEVVHGKGSLISKMPGDIWQKFANIRLLFAYMYTHPGKKLLFMGSEIGQFEEWNHERSLDWHLLDYPSHRGIQKEIQDLNRLYQKEKALYEEDFSPHGFEWVSLHDAENSVLAYLRRGSHPEDLLLVVANFTPVLRHNYCIKAPKEGAWQEIFNSDSSHYWGSNQGNYGSLTTHEGNLFLTLPPLALLILKSSA